MRILRTYIRSIASALALLTVALVALPSFAALPGPQANYKVFLPFINKPQSAASSPTPTPPTTPTPTTPTPTPPANIAKGFFALKDYLTYSAATAVDAHGVHLALFVSGEGQQEPLPQPALYTYCPGTLASCADPSKWSDFVQFSSQVADVQLATTAQGQPRMLIRRSGTSGHYEFEYYACDAQCTQGGSWSGLNVSNQAGADIYNTDESQHYFALDSQGRPRFVYGNGWGNGVDDGIYYAACDAADCTAPGSWQLTEVMPGPESQTLSGDYGSLVFDGSQPRFLFRRSLSGLPDSVLYFACDAADCAQADAWSAVQLPNQDDQVWESADLALDPQGRPRVALHSPSNIDLHVTDQLYYGWCDQDCADSAGGWQITPLIQGEGKNPDIALDPQGRLNIAYDGGQHGVLVHTWCDSSCSTAAQWKRRVLETSAQLEAQFPRAIPPHCNNEQRAWVDAIPNLAFDAQGRLAVAYDTRYVSICYYTDPSNPQNPPTSKVERIWWAVRWAEAARP